MPTQTTIEGTQSPKVRKIHNAALAYDAARAAVEVARDAMKTKKAKLTDVMKAAAEAEELSANERGQFVYKHGTVRVVYCAKDDVQCKVGADDEYEGAEDADE